MEQEDIVEIVKGTKGAGEDNAAELENVGDALSKISLKDGSNVKEEVVPLPQEEATTAIYDEIEIEDLEFVEAEGTFFYPCPCGDKFQITLEELADGEDIARCPSCSLLIRIIYDEEALEKFGVDLD